jgi:hypothetical protein
MNAEKNDQAEDQDEHTTSLPGDVLGLDQHASAGKRGLILAIAPPPNGRGKL